MKLALLRHPCQSAGHAGLSEHAEQQDASRFALLGDMVGYGADPAPVMDRIMKMARHGAVVLRGNHDAMALNPPQKSKLLGESTAAWTHAQLTAEHLASMAALPLTVRLQSCFLVHASADAPGDWRYVDDERSAGVSLAVAEADPDVRYVLVATCISKLCTTRAVEAALWPFRLPLAYPFRSRHTGTGSPRSALWSSRATAIPAPCTPRTPRLI